MRPFGPTLAAPAAAISTAMAIRGARQGSLSASGAAAAWIVGFLSVGAGPRGLVLLMFYQLGTMATRYRKEAKQARDASASEGGTRGAGQVLACSAVAVACSLAHAFLCGEEVRIDFAAYPLASSLSCAVLAHHAACLADTLASELGMLSPGAPVLIVAPWRRVPPGTNGGVTASGTAWGAAGGAAMGAGTVLTDAASGVSVRPLMTVAYGAACGLLGSFVDSVLGATVQATYYDEERKLVHTRVAGRAGALPPSTKRICGVDILSNEGVNLASVMVTTALGGMIIGPFMFGTS